MKALQSGQNLALTLHISADDEPIHFERVTSGRQESAVILGEFYKRNNGWKFRAVGQRFQGGPGPLAGHFGVEIADDPDAAAPAAAAPPPAPPPVQLSQTTLAQWVLIFRPHGFALTAPVLDFLDDDALLREEARRDIAFGFYGKTAIHPQTGLVQRRAPPSPGGRTLPSGRDCGGMRSA